MSEFEYGANPLGARHVSRLSERLEDPELPPPFCSTISSVPFGLTLVESANKKYQTCDKNVLSFIVEITQCLKLVAQLYILIVRLLKFVYNI